MTEFTGAGPYYADHAAGVGSSNDKLTSTAINSRSFTQSCLWAANSGLLWRLVKPHTTNVTTDPGAGPNDFGWNILAADMDATSNLPANRRIPAGTWSGIFAMRLAAGDLSTFVSWKYRIRIYKRSTGGSLTQIGVTADEPFGALTLAGAGDSWSLAGMPEVVLAPGETIQLEYNIQGQGEAATAVHAEIESGGSGSTDTQVSLPDLRYQYPRSASASMPLGVAIARRIAPAAKSVALSLATAISRRTSKPLAVALSLAAAVTKRTSPLPKSATLSLGTATTRQTQPASKSVSLTLGTATSRQIRIPRTASLNLGTAFARAITAYRSFTAALSLGTAFARAVISARSFTAALTLATRGRIDMSFDVLNRMAGGVRRVINYIFDD